MINIAVCDDNPVFVKELVSLIDEVFSHRHTIFTFTDPSDLIKKVNEYSGECIDIIITDIEMPDLNGIELVKKLAVIQPNLQFIFITNYAEYIEESFCVDPVYYLLKPVKKNKLRDALIKAKKNVDIADKSTFNIINKHTAIRIKYDYIKYAESYRRTIIIHETDCNTNLNLKLDDFSSKAPDYFIRVHKSYIVNMKMIKNVSNNKVELFSGEFVPVAKSKYHDIKQAILKYWGSEL